MAIESKEAAEALAIGKKNATDIASMNSNLDKILTHLSKSAATGMPNPGQLPGQGFGAPNVRNGENVMSSRGFSFMKMIGLMSGAVQPNEAKLEMDVSKRMHGCFSGGGQNAYEWKGLPSRMGHQFLAPLATSFFPEGTVEREFRYELKALVSAGVDGADPEAMRWTAKRMANSALPGSRTKALSWLQEGTGGALVAPPEMGELIELLRNKEALVNAGARVVPLPPQGRLKYPRQTSASNTYWIGENSPITESIIGTGEVTLQAKKLAVLIKAPNELIRFASPAAEALLRDDMTKSLALGLDLAGLEGLGGDNRPLGIINRQNINRISSSQPGPNGDKVVGPDVYRMIAAVEESNAEFEAYIMRPKTLYKYYQMRADAVGQGDSAGAFLFNLIREAGADTPATLAGYPVVKSTQISQSRVEGTSSNLTYIVGGMWSDLLIGMFGAIEFAATTLGDTSFVNDQTWVRGILSTDTTPRHEAAFVLLDQLNTQLV